MRLTCRGCGHDWVPRHRPSKGQKIYCPECGTFIFEYAKPLYPPKATALRETVIGDYGKKDHR
ncbi:hypothetical protein ES703_06906 [subsurface metagenome]